MGRYLTRLVLAFAMMALTSIAIAQDHQQFRVATFNVRQVNSSDTGAYDWSNRRDGVLAAVDARDADVFGLQEASNPLIWTAFSDHFDQNYDHYQPSGGSPKLIYFRRARFARLEPNEEGNLKFENPYDENETCFGNSKSRTAAWIKLRDIRSGRVYMFINLHVAHQTACWHMRNLAAEHIHEHLAAHASPDTTFVIFGDFNMDDQGADTDPRDKMLTILEESRTGYRMRRSARYTGVTTTSVRTFNSAWKSPSSNAIRLDHILVSADDATTYRQGVDYRTINDLLGAGANISPSDHFLVHADIGPAPFSFNSVLSTREGTTADHVSFGDVNGDGSVDLITWKSTVDSGRVHVHLSDGLGEFASDPLVDTVQGDAGEWRFFADIDGDGCADRISWSPSIDAGALRVGASKCDGQFDATETSSAGATDSGTKWFFVRLNDDACMDRVSWSPNQDSGETRIALAACDGTLNFNAQEITDDDANSIQQLAFADVNADGLDDKLAWHPSQAEGSTRIHLGNGDGTFTFLENSPAGPSGSTETQFYFGDVDGDGSAEKLFWRHSYRQGYIQLYPGSSSGFIRHPAMVNSGPSTDSDTAFHLADVNGDGSDDLIRWNSADRPNEVRVYLALMTTPQPIPEPPALDAGVDGGADMGATDEADASNDGTPIAPATDMGTLTTSSGCGCQAVPLANAWTGLLSILMLFGWRLVRRS